MSPPNHGGMARGDFLHLEHLGHHLERQESHRLEPLQKASTRPSTRKASMMATSMTTTTAGC